ncbi:hypothetical protein Gasu2_70220 [Galdieria sulphuraria]|nr:hypothetical protein Gasu2_70220 [Galdieria sulphuraria]
MSFVPGSILSHDTRVTFRKLKEAVSGRTQESIESDIAYISMMKRVRSLSVVTNLLESCLEDELKQKKSSWTDLEKCWELMQLAIEEIARVDKGVDADVCSNRNLVENEDLREFERMPDLLCKQATFEENCKANSYESDAVSRNSNTAKVIDESEFPSNPTAKSAFLEFTQSYSEYSQDVSPRCLRSKRSSFSLLPNSPDQILSDEATKSFSSNEPSKDSHSLSKNKCFSRENTGLRNTSDNIIYHKEAFELHVAGAVSSFRKARLNLFNSESEASNTNCSFNQRSSVKLVKNDSLSDTLSEGDLNVSCDKYTHGLETKAKHKNFWLSFLPSYEEAVMVRNTKENSPKLSSENDSEWEAVSQQSIHNEAEHSAVAVAFRNPSKILISHGSSSLYSNTEKILLLLRQLREAFEILNASHKKRERLRLHWEDREHRWKKLSSRMQQNSSKVELERGKRWEEKARRAKRDLEHATRRIYSIVNRIEILHVPVFTGALCEILRIYMTISDAMNNGMKSLRLFLQEEDFTLKRSETRSNGIHERSSVVNRTHELLLSRHSSTMDFADEAKTETSFYRSVSPIVSPRGLEFESSKTEGYFPVSDREKEITLNNIPEEILAQIFKYLSIQERAVVAQVCKSFYGACNRGELWRKVILQSRFPSDSEPGSKLSTATLLEPFFRLHGTHIRRIEYFQACSRFAGSVPLQLIAQHCINLEELILNDAPPGSVTNELLLDIFCRAGSCLRDVELNYCNLVANASLKSLAAFCPKLERFVVRSDCLSGRSREMSTNMTSSGIHSILAHCEQLKEISVPLLLCERNLSLITERCHFLTNIHIEDPPPFRHSISANAVASEHISDTDDEYVAPRSETWHKLLEKFPNLLFTLSIEIDLSEPVSVNSPQREGIRARTGWSFEDFVETFGNRATAVTHLFIYFVCVREGITFGGIGKLFSCVANGFPRLEELRVENLDSFPMNGCSGSSLSSIDEGFVGLITNCRFLSQVSLVNFPFASHVLLYLLKLRGMQLTTLSLGLRDLYEHTGSLASKCTVEESKIPSILLAIGQFAPFLKQLCITDSEHLSRVILKNVMAKLKSLEKLIISNCRRIKQDDIDEISKRYFWVTISYVG